MKVELTPEQVRTLKSMNNYWEEISQRPDEKPVSFEEFNQLVSVLDIMQVLLIVGEYANNYKDDTVGIIK
jgi:hypothetical protein